MSKAIDEAYKTFAGLQSKRIERLNKHIKDGNLFLATLEVLGGIEQNLFAIATMLAVQTSELYEDEEEDNGNKME